jgi:ABC-type lipoprotein release transport system permease subunit
VRGLGLRGPFSLILKNIIRSKKNSLLILLLISSITFLFFIGNTIIGSSDQGLRDAYIESLTGEVILQKTSPVTMNLFGANTPVIDEFFTIPELPAYDLVLDLVRSERGWSAMTSQVSTKAFLDVLGTRAAALICGVEASSYFGMFPGLILEEGRVIGPGEYGAMMTVERAEKIRDQSGIYPALGTPLLLTSGGDLGFKIREVPLVGIFRYKNPGPLMNEIMVTDPQTARILASIQVASAAAPGADDFFDRSLEDIFDEGTVLVDDSGAEESLSPDALLSYLDSFTDEPLLPLEGGGWNFIVLRLEKGVSPGTFISSLNKKVKALGVTAVGWRLAAGNSAILLLLVQSLFNGGIFLVSAAGIIATVNILLIAVFRRTGEIGTLRAIGAGDGYIRCLILGENLILAVLAGALGVLAGAWCVAALNAAGLVIPNALIASLLGGAVLRLAFIPQVAAFSFGLAVLLSLAASVFPVETAVRIHPIVAVRQG